jgi:hypothetical protein
VSTRDAITAQQTVAIPGLTSAGELREIAWVTSEITHEHRVSAAVYARAGLSDPRPWRRPRRPRLDALIEISLVVAGS